MGPVGEDGSADVRRGDRRSLSRAAAPASTPAVSGETAKQIDEEVRSIIDECYGTAQRLLEENVDKLHDMARP